MKLKIKFLIFICISLILCAGSLCSVNAVTNETISIQKDIHAYPNPFNNESEVTKIKFTINSPKFVNNVSVIAVVYDYNGKKVWTKRIANVSLNRGETPGEIMWGGENDLGSKVANGLYFAKLIVEGPNTIYKVIKILVK